MPPKPQNRDAFELFQSHFNSRRAGISFRLLLTPTSG